MVLGGLMISRNLRKFYVDEHQMSFDIETFRRLFMKFKSNHKVGEYESILADVLCVDRATIHNWRMNSNGPSDLDKIKSLAAYWNIDYKTLLKFSGCEIMNLKLTDREKEALRRVYGSILDFLDLFERTDGFIWTANIYKYEGYGNKDGADIACDAYNSLFSALEHEYIDLGNHPLYDVLYNYIDEELFQIFDGKLDPDYRFDPIDNNGNMNPSVQEDSENARKKLRQIIDSYLN